MADPVAHHSVFPRSRQPHRAVDDADHAVSLRIVAHISPLTGARSCDIRPTALRRRSISPNSSRAPRSANSSRPASTPVAVESGGETVHRLRPRRLADALAHVAEISIVLAKARAEIGDHQNRALAVGQRGLDDGGVAFVDLAAGGLGRAACQQVAEHRIGVESRHAGPHMGAIAVYQGGDLAISGHRQVKSCGAHRRWILRRPPLAAASRAAGRDSPAGIWPRSGPAHLCAG
jgi:hypothetical protein